MNASRPSARPPSSRLRPIATIAAAIALAASIAGCRDRSIETLPELGPLPERVLSFPPDRELGTIRVREWKGADDLVWSHNLFSRRADVWRPLAPARGEVRIPEGKVALIETTGLGEDLLSRVADLPPESLLEVRLLPETDRANLPVLERLTRVRRLDLRGADVGDEDLPLVAGRLDLEALYLRETRVTDAGLAALEPLARLQLLDLNGQTGVTDKGYEHLRKMRSLRFLDLRNTSITYACRVALQRALPLCRVLSNAQKPKLPSADDDKPIS